MYLNNTLSNPQSQIEKLVLSLSVGEQKSLHALSELSNIFGEVIFPAQGTIADKTAQHLNTAHRHTNKLDNYGLVHKTYRGFKQTCEYRLNDLLLNNYNLRQKLSQVIPAFKWFSKTLLASLRKSDKLNTSRGVLIKDCDNGGDTQRSSLSLSINPGGGRTGPFPTLTHCKRQDTSLPRVCQEKKEEKREKMFESKLAPEMVVRWGLNELGVRRMDVYPTSVLDYLWNEWNSLDRKPPKVASWLFMVAREYCTNQGIRPRWKPWLDYRDAFAINEKTAVYTTLMPSSLESEESTKRVDKLCKINHLQTQIKFFTKTNPTAVGKVEAELERVRNDEPEFQLRVEDVANEVYVFMKPDAVQKLAKLVGEEVAYNLRDAQVLRLIGDRELNEFNPPEAYLAKIKREVGVSSMDKSL